MARFTDRGAGAPVAAVGIVKPPAVSERSCHACLSYDHPREKMVVAGTELVVLCTDAAACCNRYRHGTGPSTYAACLRGEILGVAP